MQTEKLRRTCIWTVAEQAAGINSLMLCLNFILKHSKDKMVGELFILQILLYCSMLVMSTLIETLLIVFIAGNPNKLN